MTTEVSESRKSAPPEPQKTHRRLSSRPSSHPLHLTSPKQSRSPVPRNDKIQNQCLFGSEGRSRSRLQVYLGSEFFDITRQQTLGARLTLWYLKLISQQRENKTFLARLCEQAERYDEMVTYMKEVAKVRS